MDPGEKLSDWLVRAAARGAVRGELWTHGSIGGGRCAGTYPSLEDPAAAADEIEADARAHGREQNGEKVTYAVTAHDVGGTKIGETFVEVPGKNVRGLGGNAALPPAHDTATALAHLVNGFNRLADTNIKAHSIKCTACAAWQALVTELTKRTADLESRLTGMIAQQQRYVLFEQEQREISRRHEREDRTFAMLQSKAEILFPMMANRFATGGDPRKGAPLGGAILESILGTITPEQMEGLASTGTISFSPEQIAGFLEIYTAYAAAHRARTMLNAGEAPAPATSNGVSPKEPAS